MSKATLTYHRYQKEYTDEHDSVESAMSQAFYGWDVGEIYPVKITSCGVVVWDLEIDGIQEFERRAKIVKSAYRDMGAELDAMAAASQKSGAQATEALEKAIADVESKAEDTNATKGDHSGFSSSFKSLSDG